MTRIERLLAEDARVIESVLDDLMAHMCAVEAERTKLLVAARDALAAIVAGDTRAAAGALRGALR